MSDGGASLIELSFKLIDSELTEHDFVDRLVAELLRRGPQHLVIRTVDLHLVAKSWERKN